jgi:hypothetical protein
VNRFEMGGEWCHQIRRKRRGRRLERDDEALAPGLDRKVPIPPIQVGKPRSIGALEAEMDLAESEARLRDPSLFCDLEHGFVNQVVGMESQAGLEPLMKAQL